MKLFRFNGGRIGITLDNNSYDITDALGPGANTIEIRVTNLWVNRLIGDAQQNAEKVAFTVSPAYTPGAPLRPSGLLGPVRIFEASRR